MRGSRCGGHFGFLVNSYTAANSFLHNRLPISQSSLSSLCSCLTAFGILCQSNLAWSLREEEWERENERGRKSERGNERGRKSEMGVREG